MSQLPFLQTEGWHLSRNSPPAAGQTDGMGWDALESHEHLQRRHEDSLWPLSFSGG